jgi:hypothetical protein
VFIQLKTDKRLRMAPPPFNGIVPVVVLSD